jgi:hypothetical protein
MMEPGCPQPGEGARGIEKNGPASREQAVSKEFT